MFGARRAGLQKFSATAPRECEIEAACFAMILTACRACDIFVHSRRLTRKITAWLKGFCGVRKLLQDRHKKKLIGQSVGCLTAAANVIAESSSVFVPASTTPASSAGVPSARLLTRLLAELGDAMREP